MLVLSIDCPSSGSDSLSGCLCLSLSVSLYLSPSIFLLTRWCVHVLVCRRLVVFLFVLLPVFVRPFVVCFNLRATKRGGGTTLRFVRCHTFCIWNRIFTF